jgi:hypothetical protein
MIRERPAEVAVAANLVAGKTRAQEVTKYSL